MAIMRVCAGCGAGFPEDDLDVLCGGCRDRLWAELAETLVDSRAKALAAHAWAHLTWWGEMRARHCRRLREAS